MLDFTEQVPSTEFPPVSSLDTPIVSDNLPDTNPTHGGKIYPSLSDPDTSAATLGKLLPYMDSPDIQFVQDVEDDDYFSDPTNVIAEKTAKEYLAGCTE